MTGTIDGSKAEKLCTKGQLPKVSSEECNAVRDALLFISTWAKKIEREKV